MKVGIGIGIGIGLIAGLVLGVLLGLAIAVNSPEANRTTALAPPTKMPAKEISQDSRAPEQASTDYSHGLGETLFTRHCATCHGAEGKGDGSAAHLLSPRPRDLTSGQYRLISTVSGISREDILKVITKGMPGSAMPPWDRLPESEREALTDYTVSLAGKRGKQKPQLLKVPTQSTNDAASQSRGEALFKANCALCHGPDGKGEVPQVMVDSSGFPIRARDLTMGVYKGGSEPQELFKRIRLGLPGSPMPAHPNLSDADVWDLVHFVKSLASIREEEGDFRQHYQEISARHINTALPSDPWDDAWKTLPTHNLATMPLWFRRTYVPSVQLQVAYDKKEIALRLSWRDENPNRHQLNTSAFTDACAVQWTAQKDPPFFAMGEKGMEDVHIWMWKAVHQKDKEEGYQDIQVIYPNMYVARYAELKKGPVAERITEQAKLPIEDHKEAFLPARDLGNVVSSTPDGAVESMTAHGFGTLARRPNADEGVRARGAWKGGAYAVVFRRPLKQRGSNGADLSPGQTMHVAFAVWDGAAGDRNGQKSVTIWHSLTLAAR